MEKFEKEKASVWKSDPLSKIIIPKTDVEKLRADLYDLGMTHTSIYPDLEGLAQELRFKHKF